MSEHLIKLANPAAHVARWFALEDFCNLENLIQAVEERLIAPFHADGITTESLKLIDSIGFSEGDDDPRCYSSNNYPAHPRNLAQAWAEAGFGYSS